MQNSKVSFMFQQPMRKASFVKRLNRFSGLIKDVKEIKKVHIPNSGRLNEILKKNAICYYLPKKGNKTEGVLHLVKNNSMLISIDSRIPNHLIYSFYSNRKNSKKFKAVLKEKKFGKSRFDIQIKDHDTDTFVEIKSVSLVKNQIALFPDGVTERGKKHLRELISLKEQGMGAKIYFVIQREDVEYFSSNDEVDPEFGELLREAMKKGVEIKALKCRVNLKEISLHEEIPVIF
ncbi:MAG: DNA/RNA nuclease SfsA [Acidobacteriota bacterium]